MFLYQEYIYAYVQAGPISFCRNLLALRLPNHGHATSACNSRRNTPVIAPLLRSVAHYFFFISTDPSKKEP